MISLIEYQRTHPLGAPGPLEQPQRVLNENVPQNGDEGGLEAGQQLEEPADMDFDYDYDDAADDADDARKY